MKMVRYRSRSGQITTMLGIDTVHARASFDAMDANGDSIVSKEEFTAYLKEFYLTAEDKLKSSLLLGPLY